MFIDLIVWDAEDDPLGKTQHIVGPGEVTVEEVEEVLFNHPGNRPDAYSDTAGNPIVFGTTSAGNRIAVVYTDESDSDLIIIRPVTAFPVREYED